MGSATPPTTQGQRDEARRQWQYLSGRHKNAGSAWSQTDQGYIAALLQSCAELTANQRVISPPISGSTIDYLNVCMRDEESVWESQDRVAVAILLGWVMGREIEDQRMTIS
jgi:hypothetical protein